MNFSYIPQGVCSRKMEFEIENDKIIDAKITGGCNGNTQGISKLIIGMDINTAIERLSGIDCNGRGTSCPDQLAKALSLYKAQEK